MDTPTILYEDNHVIVAVKQPNQLVQGDATGDQDLLSQINPSLTNQWDAIKTD